MELPLDDADPGDAPPEVLTLTIAPRQAGERLDKALATAASEVPGLSRSRLAQLIAGGSVRDPEGRTVTEVKAKVKPGDWTLDLPPPAPASPLPEAIPLDIRYEDDALIVVNKPAGMVVHPAPGAETGTLVNALLHHCGDTLSGIGGERRPGIVHRLDKDTSGLLVVAKTQSAHEELARRFAAHDIERRYLAVMWGAPGPEDARLAGMPGIGFEPGGILRVDRPIGRHPVDRKRMAVTGRGRRAVTRFRVLERYSAGRFLASLTECRLETGRTHQIRVHAAHVGHPLIGDPVYGRARKLPQDLPDDLARAVKDFGRQALHAASLGFSHPISGTWLSFEAELPDDMMGLIKVLGRNPVSER